jgi:leader peptidase (prepilin peptidase) / N-methyltransferase
VPPITAADLPLWFIRVFAFAWGAIWGSFANVVVYRWPRELSLTHPPSRCPHCETPIRFYDNVPVLGWMWLRGKCRACKAPISPRYPFVEALYAVAALAIAERVTQMNPVLSVAVALFLLRFSLAWGLLTVAFIDMETFLIPDFISIGGTVLGLVASVLVPGAGWRASASGAFLGFSLLFSLHFIWSRFLKREGMGLGDAKLLAMIGAFQGPAGVLFALVAGSVQGLLATTVSRLTGWQLGPDPSLLDFDDDDDDETEKPAVNAEAAPRENETEAKPAVTDEAKPAEGEVTEAKTDAGVTETRSDPGFMRTVIPFGPFLALGALEYLLGAEDYVRAVIESLTMP